MNNQDIDARYLELTASGIRSEGMVEQDGNGWAVYECGPLGGGSWRHITAERVPALRAAFVANCEKSVAMNKAMETNATTVPLPRVTTAPHIRDLIASGKVTVPAAALPAAPTRPAAPAAHRAPVAPTPAPSPWAKAVKLLTERYLLTHPSHDVDAATHAKAEGTSKVTGIWAKAVKRVTAESAHAKPKDDTNSDTTTSGLWAGAVKRLAHTQ